MNIDNEDFGTLAVCSIRYCRGRQTYMPALVRGIIKGHLSEISDKDLHVLINDCDYTLKFEDEIEPKEWAEWKAMLIAEQDKRRKDKANTKTKPDIDSFGVAGY